MSSFVPLSSRYAQGWFEVVVNKETNALDSLSAAAQPAADFAKLLDGLAIGDEMAVKPGRNALKYQ
jgi:hypothetical protein